MRLDSPVGPLWIEADADAVTAIYWTVPETAASPPTPEARALLEHAAEELESYFSGQLRVFLTPLKPQGTAFQRQMWAILQSIPFGETRSYGEVATLLAKPNASRAVGAAAARNPIPIMIPCHRVVGKNGALTGFAGGITCKRQLLALEGVAC